MKRTPLKRTQMKTERKPLRPVSKTKRRRKEQAKGPSMGELRELLYFRCGGHCEHCGRIFHIDQMEAHHRKKRSQGGLDRIENLVALCVHCHVPWAHGSPFESIKYGFTVLRDEDPGYVKIQVWAYTMAPVYLTADGRYALSHFEEEK